MRPTVEDNDFVRCVDIQDIIKRPRVIISVQGCVRTRVAHLDRRVGELGNKFLDAAHALHASDGEPKAGLYQKVRSMLYDTEYVCQERTSTNA